MRSGYLSTIILLLILHPAIAQTTLYNTEPDALYRKGVDLMEKADYAAAREAFESYLATGDNQLKMTEAEYYIAFSALSLFHQDGEKLVDNFIRDHPSNPKAGVAYYELGDFYYHQKNYTKAIEYLSKANFQALSLEQRNNLIFELGYSHFTKRQFSPALTQFNKLKAGNSAYNASSNYYAGYIYYEQGKYDEAIADLRRAGQHEAYKSVVPGMIASIYYNQKRYDDLIAYGDEILGSEKRVNEKEFYLLMADAYLYKENYQKAGEYYDEYLARTSTPSLPVRYRIGLTAYKLGDHQGAIDQFKVVATENDSTGIYASYYLGILYLKEGNKNYAITAFDKARKSELNPSLTEESTYQYVKVALDLGRTEEAIRVMNDFTGDFPQSSHLDEVNDLLSQAYLNSNNYNLAIRHIEALASVNRNLQTIYQKATYLKGAEEFNKGNYQDAIQLFDKSLKYQVDPVFTAKASVWAGEAFSVGRRYEEAIPYYKRVTGLPNSPDKESLLKAEYGLGYALYNTKAYGEALSYFRSYVQQLKGAGDRAFYQDALLRLADCYYVEKQYDQALQNYREAIAAKTPDQDYAHLQSAVVLGIMGNVEDANREYDAVIRNYPRSSYMDDALYQRAQLNFEKGNFSKAISGFSEMISKKPNSQYIPYAYMRRGAAHYNLQEYDDAISDYKAVIDKYPTHSVASEVILSLQNVLSVQGRSGEFDKYLASYKQANPNGQGVEALEFETASNQYYNLEYEKAIQGFQNYIRSYPDNAKVNDAQFLIAESFYRLGKTDQAIPVYESLAGQKNFAQYNRVIERLADLESAAGATKKSMDRYYQLAAIAGNKKQQFNAWSGLMRGYYELGKYDSVRQYANRILEKGNVNIGAQNMAYLYLAKASYARGDMKQAEDEFLTTLNAARDQYGAEAQYLLGELYYKQEDYKRSVETLVNLTKNFSSYQDWVGKSYLLMADNYVGMEDYFQAEGTLQSLIDNFPDQNIKDLAAEKLIRVHQLSADQSTPEPDESDTLINGN